MSTIQNLRKSLVRSWKPVCSLVGVPSLRPSLLLSPPPCLLPPAGMGRSAAGLLSLESLSLFALQTAGRVFGRVHFLSLLLSHSLSCYLTLAPSNCPQGIWAGPYPKQCRPAPLRSVLLPLAGGGCGHLGYFSAGSCF